MIIELRTRKRDVEDDDENDIEHTRRYEKSAVKLTLFVLETSNWCFTCRIWIRICSNRVGSLTCTQDSLMFQFLIMISPITSQLYHHPRIQSYVIHLYHSIPSSWINTEYHTHQVLHHPKIYCVLLPVSFSSFCRCYTQLTTFPQLRVNKWIESHHQSWLPPNLLPPDLPPPDTPPISLDNSVHVYLQSGSITA